MQRPQLASCHPEYLSELMSSVRVQYLPPLCRQEADCAGSRDCSPSPLLTAGSPSVKVLLRLLSSLDLTGQTFSAETQCLNIMGLEVTLISRMLRI